MCVCDLAQRAVFYSSGWENIHRVKPVTGGERWAFVAVFAADSVGSSELAHDALSDGDEGERAQAFASACVHPISPSDYIRCAEAWTPALTSQVDFTREL